jgi:hypothetical protein
MLHRFSGIKNMPETYLISQDRNTSWDQLENRLNSLAHFQTSGLADTATHSSAIRTDPQFDGIISYTMDQLLAKVDETRAAVTRSDSFPCYRVSHKSV